MTSLIDVIFLLLLFFMLSSTFTRFGEVEFASTGSQGASPHDQPVFMTLAAASLLLNGRGTMIADLPQSLDRHRDGAAPLHVLVALRSDVTAQRLTDLLAALRKLPALQVTVLETA